MIPAVRIEGLSKQYRIGTHEHAAYRTLRESISSVAAAPWRRWRSKQKAVSRAGVNGAPAHNGELHRQNGHSLVNGDISGKTFWALDDVSFDVQHGEVVGIIGRNGAGKSTLLKVLSRITEPTKGRVTINGRVASLLEVGTGFHPELTGRENVYLNGVMLGMKRREIDRKFDAIVDFSGIEKFLDTPVKRYSSGMYVRLAFAVAAHLDPEILIVDEVLAVGDAEFQKKCLGKMQDVAGSGRTVLFVSHNMEAVQRLCQRVVCMRNGRIDTVGPSEQVIPIYLSAGEVVNSNGGWIDVSGAVRRGTGQATFQAVQVASENADVAFQPYPNGEVEFSLRIHSDEPRQVTSLAVTLFDRFGTKLVNADTLSIGKIIKLRTGTNQVRLRINHLRLNPGTYQIGLWMANSPVIFDHAEHAFITEVVSWEPKSFGQRPPCDGLVTCAFKIIEGDSA